MAIWTMDELPYDAMGDFSAFTFDFQMEDGICMDRDRTEEEAVD